MSKEENNKGMGYLDGVKYLDRISKQLSFFTYIFKHNELRPKPYGKSTDQYLNYFYYIYLDKMNTSHQNISRNFNNQSPYTTTMVAERRSENTPDLLNINLSTCNGSVCPCIHTYE